MPFPTSQLSAENVLRDVHDPTSQTLRTTATATIIAPGGIEVDIDQSTDSIAIGDGTNLFTSTSLSGKVGLDVNIITQNLDIRDLNFATDKVDVTGSSVAVSNFPSVQTVSAVDLDIRDLDAVQDSVSVGDGVNFLSINPDGSIQVAANDLDIRNLTFVSDKVDVTGSTVSVNNFPSTQTVNAVDLDIRNLNAVTDSVSADLLVGGVAVSPSNPVPIEGQVDVVLSDEPIKMSGTIDGTPNGTEYTFVNNQRQQILSSHDRIADFTYADFGTKNQRVTQIDYNSATFPGVTVRRVFTYTLVGNNYRRDDESWQIV